MCEVPNIWTAIYLLQQQKLYNIDTPRNSRGVNKMLRMKKLSEVANLQVFTETGEHFGEIEEAILAKNKVESWKIRATRDSFLSKALSGAKGVVVPHLMVKALGDIMIVSKNAAPRYSEEDEQTKQ